MKGEYPIVLLDDIFSELDLMRQNMLLDTFKKTQTFVTAAEDVNVNISSTKYRVSQKCVQKV